MTPVVRSIFAATSRVSPRLAGWLALLLFSTPLPTGRLSAAERRLEQRAKARLADAERLTLTTDRGRRLIAYRLGRRVSDTGRTVVMVHGWMSGARYMLALAEAFVEAGDEVVCFDLPAHGESGGIMTDLTDCAQALVEVAAAVGAVNLIVAHSFGGAVTAYATGHLGLTLAGNDARIILLASPNRLSVVTRRFGDAIGLSAAARADYERRLCAPIGGNLAALDGNLLFGRIGVPLHVIHCADDAEVAFAEGLRFAELGEQVQITQLSKLGHRRILYAPRAIEALGVARGMVVG
jgi:pimeloyl-ACP methyl ester carboxylesterase